MKKRILSLAVALVMVVIAFPMFSGTVQAATPHPFATELREFFSDATGFTSAVLIDLDEDGIEEMFAVKNIDITATYALFYFDSNGNVDVDYISFYDSGLNITEKNYFASLYSVAYTVYSHEKGQGFQRVNGSIHMDKDESPELPELHARYGIGTDKKSLSDNNETAQILAMTTTRPATAPPHPFATALRALRAGSGLYKTAVLADLDNEGTAEMITYRFHNKDGDFELSIYGIENGRSIVVRDENIAADYFEALEVYVSAENYIIIYAAAGEMFIHIVYEYKDGKLAKNEVVGYWDWDPDAATDYPSKIVAQIDGREVTDREFHDFSARVGMSKTKKKIVQLKYNPDNPYEPINTATDDSAKIRTMTTESAAPAPTQNNQIAVTINNTPVNFTGQAPVNVNGRVLVPVRGVFETLGFNVSWNEQARQATLSRANDKIVITIDSATFTANGVSRTLDVPAQIIGGSTMLPIRAVLEAVGYSLDWNENSRTVIITAN